MGFDPSAIQSCSLLNLLLKVIDSRNWKQRKHMVNLKLSTEAETKLRINQTGTISINWLYLAQLKTRLRTCRQTIVWSFWTLSWLKANLFSFNFDMTSHIHYFKTLNSVRTRMISYSIHLNSWQPGVAPCMHGALSTQKLELHAIQLWGCTAENKELSGFCFQQVAPGPAVFGETQILYLQAKKQ